MSLFVYKGLITLIIAIVTLTAGFTSLHFIRRYQHLLSIGDAFADGIFLGTAVFHLLPNAVRGLSNKLNTLSSYVLVIVLMGCVSLFLFILEHSIILRKKELHIISTKQICTASTWILIGILSIHAFTAGAALGISNSTKVVSILLIAILAHKGFESFALMIELHRGIKKENKIKVILWAFTFVTPFGIIVTAFIESFLQTQTTPIINSLFSTFAASNFFYIGTLHGGHESFHPQGNFLKLYQKIFSTSLGVVAMGILAIWI
ncbi:ZIP family metal transporter [Coxiella endosymbiont of Rhipicephalus microplus]|uniref:ZIP family metal transporter n=1 Tax=Coxiella endosymbiont of Rhipicephalus microplus TaxID=1656186 RepID=UPI000C80EDE8|nr:ZIP family metal transporter [Coxiella endosymbiont of Rhipicephalus microplus]PMB54606.1 Zinc transporter, ZIP family [Coxiella-like endosymbiont]